MTETATATRCTYVDGCQDAGAVTMDGDTFCAFHALHLWGDRAAVAYGIVEMGARAETAERVATAVIRCNCGGVGYMQHLTSCAVFSFDMTGGIG